MPKYEKAAQSPDLRKIERRSRNRFVVAETADFFVGMTAMLSPRPGSYFPQVQKCMADADTLIERFELLQGEDITVITFSQRPGEAKSTEELQSYREKYHPVTEPIGRSWLDILREQFRILRRIVPDRRHHCHEVRDIMKRPSISI